jgi:nucleotide-binding universal stress UspA family protein
MIFNKILVPTELDELSVKVTGFAVSLAQEMNISEIVLLNIIIPAQTQALAASGGAVNTPMVLTGEFNTELEKKHKKIAKEQAEKASTDQVIVKPHVTFGSSKSNLNEYMKNFGADLIVCGSQDHETFLDKIFGSETHRMIKNTDYPMIILKKGVETPQVREIAVAIDVGEKDQSGLEIVRDFAAILKAKIQLIHVITDDDETKSEAAIESLRMLALEKNLTNYAINVVNNNALEEGLRNFIRKYNPDLVAVLTQGKGKLKKLIYGSGTDDILKETDKPVFVCKMV